MQLYLSSNKGERAGVPPGLPAGGASTHAAASAPAHAHAHTHRTETPNTVLPPSVGIVNGGFWVCAQGSATQRQPESFHKPPRGRPLGGSNAIWGSACSSFVSQGGNARACLQVYRHGAEAGKLPHPHTHAGTSTHASHAEDMNVNLFHGLRFLICVYFILLRHSANRNHSANRRGVRACGGGELAMPFGA